MSVPNEGPEMKKKTVVLKFQEEKYTPKFAPENTTLSFFNHIFY